MMFLLLKIVLRELSSSDAKPIPERVTVSTTVRPETGGGDADSSDAQLKPKGKGTLRMTAFLFIFNFLLTRHVLSAWQN